MNVLVIVAHPDDEVLGAGGIIAKHTKKGDKVKVIFLATGISSRFEGKKTTNVIKKKIVKLQKDAKKALKILGVTNCTFYKFPDNKMDSVPLLDIVKVIENEIKIIKPKRIFTHHREDLNIDHRTVFNATLTACRPIEGIVDEIISFEVPSSTEWNYPVTFNPNYFVNIEKELDKKIKAMKAYKNEIKDFPHPRSAKYLEHNCFRWGSVSGNHCAEAFEIIRKIEK
jgi:LmbE family N-acetylglucosaminyl deacetylase